MEFEWAMRQVHAARQRTTSTARDEGGGRGHPRPRDGRQPRHGSSMSICPGRKAIVWAHNAHVSRAPFTMPDAFGGTLIDMIYHLSDRLGDDLVSIAGVLLQGEYGEGRRGRPESGRPYRHDVSRWSARAGGGRI